MTDAIPVPSGTAATFSRLADCLALGVCCAVASVGIVTAAPALAAAAVVVRGWETGRERPLVATFLSTVRAETRRLLLPQLALLGVLAVVWLDVAVAAAGLPGGALVRAAGLAAGGFAIVSFLAMFADRAAHGGTWWTAWRRAATGQVRRPWLPVALLAVVAATGLMVAAAPPIFAVAGGPLMLAVGVLYSRASA